MDSSQSMGHGASPPQQLQDLAATAALSTVAAPLAASSHGGATPQSAAAAPGDTSPADDDEDDPVTDGRRNWSNDVTLKLVKIWKRACLSHPNVGRVARMQIVYDEFKEAVDCSNRSRKAIEDKLYTMKQMYHFIVQANASFRRPMGGAPEKQSPPTWFELSKEERRAVRSLHRIRIPNISLDVFLVLDSVLNPNLTARPEHASAEKSPVAQSSPAPSPYTTNVLVSVSAAGSSAAPSSFASADTSAALTPTNVNAEVLDSKRNWSHEVTLQLAKAWHNVVHGRRDLRGAMLSQRVYNEFMKAVGGCSRSRKAIEDKMHSMKEMYSFIRVYNSTCVTGLGKTPWFELSKLDRRQLRTKHKIRVPNLTPEVYNELDAFLLDNADNAEMFPSGIATLIAAEQAPMMLPSHQAAATPPSGTGSAGSVSGRLAGGIDAVLTNTYEVMRRLAKEETQLSPAPPPTCQSSYPQPPPPQELQQQQQQPQQQQPPTITASQSMVAHEQTQEGERSGDADGERPSKRPRPTVEPTSDQKLQQLLALQQHAIVERRQQHAEQMALLLEIAGLLRQQHSASA